MSADITEKKPKKAATKKTTSVGEIPSAAVKAIRAKSTPKATAENAGDEVRPSETKRAPSHEEISSLAHRFFEQRGRQHGSHTQDWFRAEQELAHVS
jgi:hypothetical protein